MVSGEFRTGHFLPPEWSSAFYSAAMDQKNQGAAVLRHGIAGHEATYAKLCDPSESARVLVIGPDQALTEAPVLDWVLAQRKGGATEINAVDPNPQAKNSLPDRLPRINEDEAVTYRFHNTTVEEFAEADRTYDLILAVHSLHYIAMHKKMAERGHDFLKVMRTLRRWSGLVAIVGQHDDFRGVLGFREKCWDILGAESGQIRDKQEFEIDDRALRWLMEETLESGQRSVDWISHLTYAWVLDLTVFPENLQSPRVLQELPPPASHLLSFLMRTDWESIPEAAKLKILRELDGRTKDEAKTRFVDETEEEAHQRPSRHLIGRDTALFVSAQDSTIKQRNRLDRLVVEAKYGNMV